MSNDKIKRAKELRAMIERLAKEIPTEEAEAYVELFPAWKAGTVYAIGDKVRHDGKVWQVLQPHTAQETWTPEAATGLFARVIRGEDLPGDEIPEWVQPDSTNPYHKGDLVKHNNTTWRSLIDGNVWEPSDQLPALWEVVA